MDRTSRSSSARTSPSPRSGRGPGRDFEQRAADGRSLRVGCVRLPGRPSEHIHPVGVVLRRRAGSLDRERRGPAFLRLVSHARAGVRASGAALGRPGISVTGAACVGARRGDPLDRLPGEPPDHRARANRRRDHRPQRSAKIDLSGERGDPIAPTIRAEPLIRWAWRRVSSGSRASSAVCSAWRSSPLVSRNSSRRLAASPLSPPVTASSVAASSFGSPGLLTSPVSVGWCQRRPLR